MTFRLPTAITALVLIPTVAAAAPTLSGTYTIADTEICQAVGSGSVPGNRGTTTQGLGIVQVTGTTMAFTGDFASGRLIAKSTEQITVSSVTESQTFVITGSANPYSLTMTKPSGKSLTVKAHFDEVGPDGVARSMVTLGSYANGTTAKNCVSQMVFTAH
jgi:hypothetical protein